MFIVFIW